MEEKKEMAESQISICTKYSTTNAGALEQKVTEVSEEHMSTAGMHFNRRASEHEAEKKKPAKEKGPGMMPAAIQYFTLKAQEERKKKEGALEMLKTAPPQVLVGVAHFTKIM